MPNVKLLFPFPVIGKIKTCPEILYFAIISTLGKRA